MKLNEKSECRIGVISDTHGLLRPEAMDILQGSDFIIHAGDIGGQNIIKELEGIAPVVSVRGNTDFGDFAKTLLNTNMLQVEDQSVYILHDLNMLDLDPVVAELNIIISGHTHRPMIKEKDGILYFNPGSAGPRRPGTFVTVGMLHFKNGKFNPQIVSLNDQ